MSIVEPSSPLSPEQRAHQMWSVHPRDLDRLGFTREQAAKDCVHVPHHESGRWTLGAREQFYLAHISAAIDQAVVPLPETENTMHMLRRFALDHKQGEPIRLTPDDSQKLAESILAALSSLDGLWEAVNQRKLTDEEKGLVR